MRAESPKVATKAYAMASVRGWRQLYCRWNVRWSVKKSPGKMRTDVLTSMARRSAPTSPYSDMYARTGGFVSTKIAKNVRL